MENSGEYLDPFDPNLRDFVQQSIEASQFQAPVPHPRPLTKDKPKVKAEHTKSTRSENKNENRKDDNKKDDRKKSDVKRSKKSNSTSERGTVEKISTNDKTNVRTNDKTNDKRSSVNPKNNSVNQDHLVLNTNVTSTNTKNGSQNVNQRITQIETRNETQNGTQTEGEGIGQDKKQKLVSIISRIENNTRKQKLLDETKSDLNKQIEQLKSEIGNWMASNIPDETGFTWKKMSINKSKKVPPKRFYASDILEIVRRLKGEEVLDQVIDELDKIHTAKYSEEEIRVNTNCAVKRKKNENTTSTTSNPSIKLPSTKKKKSMEL